PDRPLCGCRVAWQAEPAAREVVRCWRASSKSRGVIPASPRKWHYCRGRVKMTVLARGKLKMHYIRMLFVGLIVGLLSSWFYGFFVKGVHLGLVKAAIVGILGSYVFGLIGHALHPASKEPLHPAGFFYSILGSVALIYLGHNVVGLL